MTQLTVADLRNAIKDMPDHYPIFFRRIMPIAGTIEEAGSASLSAFSFFGTISPCVIIEPMQDDEPAPSSEKGREG